MYAVRKSLQFFVIIRIFVSGILKSTRRRPLNRVQTRAGHSIALHVVSLWPWPLDLILNW